MSQSKKVNSIPTAQSPNVEPLHSYTPMLQALQAHWKANANAYPQKFVLTDAALATLNQVRKLVNDTLVTQPAPGWESKFMGVTLTTGPTNVMLGADGTETPLQ